MHVYIIRNMSNNKTYDLDDLAEIFKALSNPNRLKIFYRLASCCAPGTVGIIADRDTAYVGELGEELDIVKSTVSHHIKELRRVGLIRTRRRGQNIECWVDPQLVARLKTFFAF
jgi:DNA-binding transcriptional ArsR family regulator